MARRFFPKAPTLQIHWEFSARCKIAAQSITAPASKCKSHHSGFESPRAVCGPSPLTNENFIKRPLPSKKQKLKYSVKSAILRNDVFILC